MEKKERDGEGEFSLANMIRTMSHGQFNDDVSGALGALWKEMERVNRSTGGKCKGKLVVTINFSQDRGTMDVEPVFKVTSPSPTRARWTLFTDGRGGLSRINADQRSLPGMGEDMPIRDVPAPEVRTVNTPEPEVRSAVAERPDVVDIGRRQANDK